MNKNEERAEEIRVYEVSFLVSPTLAPENANAVYSEVEEMVTKLGGSIIDGEEPRMRRLAYPMFGFIGGSKHAFNEAFFAWTKFDLLPENIETINSSLKKKEEIIRFLTITTVREKTYLPKVMPDEMMSDEDSENDLEDLVVEEAQPEVIAEVVAEEKTEE